MDKVICSSDIKQVSFINYNVHYQISNYFVLPHKDLIHQTSFVYAAFFPSPEDTKEMIMLTQALQRHVERQGVSVLLLCEEITQIK